MHQYYESQQKFYNKQIQYGNYIRNIIMPFDMLKNDRNVNGVKNTGENDSKLDNSMIRSKTTAIRKAFHNFSDIKQLTFLTLTYALDEKDPKKCKRDLNKFFKNLKYYFKKQNQEIKYLYVYEYQTLNRDGVVHFHLLINNKIPHHIVLKYWPYGLNKNLLVRQKTNEAVALYLSKYVSKAFISDRLNQYDLNIKAYQFSYNCKNPVILKRVFTSSMKNLMQLIIGSTYFKFMKRKMENLTQLVTGVIYEFKKDEYVDFETMPYRRIRHTASDLCFERELKKLIH